MPPAPSSPGGGFGPSAPSSPVPASGNFGMYFEIEDMSSWTYWWEFNQAPYLRLQEAVRRGLAVTSEDDFTLGDGMAARKAADLAPDEEVVRGEIVPALLEVLEGDSDAVLTSAVLLALARIGEESGSAMGSSHLTEVMKGHLDESNHVVVENATVALGVLAHPSCVPALAALLGDTEEGRALTDRRRVPDRVRAFAAYGLGLAAQRSEIADVRRYALSHLLETLEAENTPREDQVACMIALGMAAPDSPALTGGQQGADTSPASSSEELVEFLAAYFRDRDHPDQVRAFAATSMAQLLPYVSDELRESVTRRLLAAIGRGSKEPNAVVQSSALALGLIGDADEDELDRDIRKALMRSHAKGDQLARNYALVALAQIAGRGGRGDGDPHAGTETVREFLLDTLERGKSTAKPWTGLAVGVLGDALIRERRPLEDETLEGLRAALAESRSPESTAAYSIGVGLCGDIGATDVLLAKLEKHGDPEIRAHLALALGLVGAKEAVKPLNEMLEESIHEPEVLRQAAIGLALLGHKPLVPRLLALVDECDCDVSHAAIAQAMGWTGDRRVVEPLLTMLQDEDAHDQKRAQAALGLGRVADKDPLPWTARISTGINYFDGPASLTCSEGWGIIDFD